MKSRAEQIADAFEESRFSYSIEVADIRDAAIYMADWADKNPINTHTDQAHSMLLHYQKDLSKAKETLDIALQALEKTRSFIQLTDPKLQQWPISSDSKEYVLEYSKEALTKIKSLREGKNEKEL